MSYIPPPVPFGKLRAKYKKELEEKKIIDDIKSKTEGKDSKISKSVITLDQDIKRVNDDVKMYAFYVESVLEKENPTFKCQMYNNTNKDAYSKKGKGLTSSERTLIKHPCVEIVTDGDYKKLVNTSNRVIPKGYKILFEHPFFSFSDPSEENESESKYIQSATYFIVQKNIDLKMPSEFSKLHPRKFDNETNLEYLRVFRKEYQSRLHKIHKKLLMNSHKCGDSVMLYEYASNINHSCIPNCDFKFIVDKVLPVNDILVFAKKDIQPGEEITYCYSDSIYKYKTKRSRKLQIMLHMGFKCTCSECL